MPADLLHHPSNSLLVGGGGGGIRGLRGGAANHRQITHPPSTQPAARPGKRGRKKRRFRPPTLRVFLGRGPRFHLSGSRSLHASDSLLTPALRLRGKQKTQQIFPPSLSLSLSVPPSLRPAVAALISEPPELLTSLLIVLLSLPHLFFSLPGSLETRRYD